MNKIKGIALSGAMASSLAIAMYFGSPFEGEKHAAYHDIANVWTICRGHTKNVHSGDTATKAQCEAWYRQDMTEAQAGYDAVVKKEMPANTKAAAIDFIFNLGAQSFRRSTLLKRINSGDRPGACQQFLSWRFLGPKDCAILLNKCYGLYARRKKEHDLCLNDRVYMSYDLDSNNIVMGVIGK